MSGDATAGAHTVHGYAAPAADAPRDTVVRRFLERARAEPARVALRTLVAGGASEDRELTWGEWAGAAHAVAAAAVLDGVSRGDVVAVLAGNSLHWPITEYGALVAGAVSAGVFPASGASQVADVLADCRPRVVVVDTHLQLEKVLAALGHAAAAGASPTGAVRTVVCADAAAASAASRGCAARDAGVRVVSWDAWLAAGRAHLATAGGAQEVDRRAAAAAPEDVAGLIYTSGSMGEPKGARVSHAYHLASAESIAATLGLTRDDTALAALPFAHAAERVFGLHTRVVVGMEAALVADGTRLWEAAGAYRPTLFGGLPRLYEKLHDAVIAAAGAAGGADAERWAWLLVLGRHRSLLRRAGEPVPAEIEDEWRSLRPLADAVLDPLTGGRVRVATSGGAPLARDVAELLDAVGLTVLGAYGQTEHLCVAMHRAGSYAFDSVGTPMPGTELRLASDGELLVRRSALTFSGYLNRPDATRDAFTDDGAWLRTGDVAEIDRAGRLRITGRKKEILALSTGRKVAPLPIERRLAEHAGVAHALVVGDGRKHPVALLFLRGRATADGDALDAHVDAVNATLPPHEQVRRWRAVHEELTEAGGDLTPTLKVRRAAVAARFAHVIEELYT